MTVPGAQTAADRRHRLRQLLETDYGCPEPRLTPFNEDPIKAVYRVDRADGPPWVLRHYPADRPLERLWSQAAVMRHVARHGVPMEQIVPTRDGVDTAIADGRGVLVTSFVEGTPPRRAPETLRRLGESIGLLHALPPTPGGDPLLSRRAGAMPRDDLPFGRACLDRMSGAVPAHFAAAYDGLREALHTTRTCEDLPPACHGLVHSDCHLANAIEAADGRVAWIDWDGVGHGPRVAALGLLLYTCAIQAPGEVGEAALPPSLALIEERVAAVLAGYTSHHRLTREELEYLPDAVRYRPAVVAARKLAQAIERRTSPDATGWWARYAEADDVAACARQILG